MSLRTNEGGNAQATQGSAASNAQGGGQGPRVFRYDAVQRLQQVAPIWAIISSFDCRDDLPRQQVIEASRLVELYASKTLSRSTLVVGLQNSTRPLLMQLTSVSAAFFRPLEYVLELVEGGGFYRPVSPEDLQAGLPPPDWCLPLHMQLQIQASGCQIQPVFSGEFSTLHLLATSTLSAAAYWCLVHKYHEESAKCDFNWQPRDLVAGLISKAVSPYTLVIGIDVHKDRNLPWMRPSLFVPLAAILHMHQCGIPYTSITRNDLILFNVLGYKGAMTAVLSTGAIPVVPEPLAGSSTGLGMLALQQSSTASNSDMGDLQDSSEPLMAMLRGGLRLQSTGAPSVPPAVMLQGMKPSGGPSDVSSALAALQLANNSTAAARQQGGGSVGGATLRAAGANPATLQQMAAGGFPFQQTLVTPQPQQHGLQGFSMTPQAATEPPAQAWETPVFRLFTAGAPPSRLPPPEARWWYMDGSRSVLGPFSSEQMLVSYIKGTLSDDMLVCGTSFEVAREGMVPTPPFFEALGALLRAVQHGGSYALVTADEVRASAMTRVKPAASQPPSGVGTPQTVSRSDELYKRQASAGELTGNNLDAAAAAAGVVVGWGGAGTAPAAGQPGAVVSHISH